MKLKHMSDIRSGYITRGRIVPVLNGSHYLVQAKDVDGEHLSYETKQLIRFDPALSRTDRLLEKDDLLFMARGAHHFTIQLAELPGPSLAAACFFVIRISLVDLLPGYVCWYLNQEPVTQYLVRNSGRGVHMPVVRRAVLEDIEIPIPPMPIQTKVADIDTLLHQELSLMQQLGRKRQELISAACLQTVRHY